MSRLARKHHCYVVSPIYRLAEGKRLNSAVLIDRTGTVASVYDKVFPYWNEFDLQPPALPGQHDVAVYEADFGKIGFAICYDAKFPRCSSACGTRAPSWSCGPAPTRASRSCKRSRCCTTTRS